jgi:zinc protease
MASLLVFAPTAFATSAKFQDIEIPYQKYVLANGLTLIVHEDHKTPLVAVRVYYRVGSRDERPGRSGFAHLFEHLMFNGSEHYNDEFFRALSSVGATDINGVTTTDFTTYFETVPTPALDRVLWLESDRMGHLLGALDQKKLDEQRGVVQNEKRQGDNKPYGKVEEVIAFNTYPPGHPYSWTTIGSMEDLNAASLDDVKDWFRTYYGAANAILVIGGDVKPEEIKAKVEQYFGDIPSGPALKRTQRWPSKMGGEKRAILKDRIPQYEIHKVWNVPARGARDARLLYLVAGILESNGTAGRLYERLVRKDQSATSVMTDFTARDLGSQFEVGATVKPGGDIKTTDRALDEEIAIFVRNGPTQKELDLAKTGIYASYARLEGAAAKADLLASGELTSGAPELYKQSLNWIREATVADVQAAAKRWLTDGVFALEIQPFPDYRVTQSSVDRSKLPSAGPPPALNLPPLQRSTLSNGLKLALAARHDVPVVQFSLIVDAGSSADSHFKPGTAQMAMAMLAKGTSTRDVRAITERASFLGAVLTSASDLDSSIINLNALAGQLQSSLELFSDVLLHPTFPQGELDRLKGQTLATIEQQNADPTGIAFQLLPKLIYGDTHAYSNAFAGAGSVNTVASLDRSDLLAFYGKWVRPDNATLLIVGDTTLKEIGPLLEQRLRGWKIPAKPLPQKNLSVIDFQRSPRIFLIDRPAAEQSYIVAATVAPSYSDPSYGALRAVNKILGGEFLSRLNLNLREDKHWSYGVSTEWQRNKGPGLFTVSAPVQTDKTAESMHELVKDLADVLGPRPPTPEEIKEARDSMVLKLPAGAETLSGVAGFYSSVVTFGLPDTYWNDYVAHANALTSADIQIAARKLIHPEAFTWIVVGDIAKIEDSVRRLDLGEVRILDTNGRVVR